MKGGITSGVVYPNTVSRLAETYRFVSIGGTSAGAIAAAATAAAEYRRAQGSGEGFEKYHNFPTSSLISPRVAATLTFSTFFSPTARHDCFLTSVSV